MARFVTVAAIEFRLLFAKSRPEGVGITEHVMNHLKNEIDKVLPDKPDLIVLTEACDRPDDMSPSEVLDYYAKDRGDRIIKFLGEIAKENTCYIAFGAWRMAEDGYGRNSCYMLNRNGEVIGIYDKNFIVPNEYSLYNIIPGRDEAIFECDFGRVGALTCFDMNFSEMREKYKKQKPDIVVFDSHYNGGLVRNFFALDTRAFLVSASTVPANILSPLGTVVQSATIHYNYVIATINLDYAICHLDGNRPKFQEARKKYGRNFKITDPGCLGFVMISYEGTDKTIDDVVREFDLELYDDYLARSRKTRDELLKLNKI